MLWALTVSKEEVTFETPFDLRITTVCLGKGAQKGQRYFLKLTYVNIVSEELDTSVIAVLSLGQNENVSLDLTLDEGEQIALSCDTEVHLSGYYHIDDDEMSPDFLGDSSSDDEEFDPNDISMESMESIEGAYPSDSDDDNEPKIQVVEDEALENSILDKVRAKAEAASKKRKQNPVSDAPAAKKQKTEAASPAKGKQSAPNTPTKQNEKKAEAQSPNKKAETPKKGQQPATPKQTTPQKGKADTPAKGAASPNIRKENGVTIEVLQASNNAQKATKGKTITVAYEGRLAQNKKKFDSGKFSFKLGAGKVIRGWDLGLVNMPVGEKRKLTIPANLGYGASGTDGIPPNSTLEFTVTLMSVQ